MRGGELRNSVRPSGELAFTGATIRTLLWAALLMLAAGIFLLAATRLRDDALSENL